MSTWNSDGYSELPEAVYIRTLSEDRLLNFIRRITGEEYDLSEYDGKGQKGGLIGSLNNIAINHLRELSS